MTTKTQFWGVCCVLTMAAAQVQAEEASKANTPTAKSPDAVAALKACEIAEAKAKADFDRAVADARANAVKALESAMNKATKAGNLDEAIAIREKIRQLTSVPASGADPATTRPKLFMTTDEAVGTWKEGNGAAYVLTRDGKFTYAGSQRGTWKLTADALVLTWDGGARVIEFKSKANDELTGEGTVGNIGNPRKWVKKEP